MSYSVTVLVHYITHQKGDSTQEMSFLQFVLLQFKFRSGTEPHHGTRFSFSFTFFCSGVIFW